MTRAAESDEMGRHFSELLVKIHDATGPLTGEQRTIIMLVAGFVRGQAVRIADLERRLAALTQP